MPLPEKFPQYNQIQRISMAIHNVSISTCEIADAKRRLGYRVQIAHNRINIREISKKCSDEKFNIIRKICLDFEGWLVTDIIHS